MPGPDAPVSLLRTAAHERASRNLPAGDLQTQIDALLSSVSFLFDEKYEELMACMDPEKDRFEVLMELNRELFAMIENSISLDLLARLLSTQLVTTGARHLLDHRRTYYRLLRQIIAERWLTANAVFGLCPANAVGDDIERTSFAVGDNRCAGSQGFDGNDTKIFFGGVDEAFGGIECRFQGGV